ncbi:MAG: ACT domain-containing protein [Oscillospiraceae bacterium]|nr:ACT domain-containing protein [Oscillospiraceae bacterium]
MQLEPLSYDLTVCRIRTAAEANLSAAFFCLFKTDSELSLVCLTADTPAHTVKREDGWKAFRVCGAMDFSLVGVLSKLSAVLAEKGISIFAVSSYDTDYILVKKDRFRDALQSLAEAGYTITE